MAAPSNHERLAAFAQELGFDLNYVVLRLVEAGRYELTTDAFQLRLLPGPATAGAAATVRSRIALDPSAFVSLGAEALSSRKAFITALEASGLRFAAVSIVPASVVVQERSTRQQRRLAGAGPSVDDPATIAGEILRIYNAGPVKHHVDEEPDNSSEPEFAT